MLAGVCALAVYGGIIVCSREDEMPRWRHLALRSALAWGSSLGRKCTEITATYRRLPQQAYGHFSEDRSFFVV